MFESFLTGIGDIICVMLGEVMDIIHVYIDIDSIFYLKKMNNATIIGYNSL